jgi:hypothetical protein
MQRGGNKLVNSIFEAILSSNPTSSNSGSSRSSSSSIIKPDKYTELEERSEFISKKYQHRKWYENATTKIMDAPIEEDFFASQNAKDETWWNFTNDSNDHVTNNNASSSEDPFGSPFMSVKKT